MRLSFSSRAVSMRIGTADPARIALARSKPFSPGIMTSRMRRSKLSPSSLALASRERFRSGDAIALPDQKTRQQNADAAIVVNDEQVGRVVGRVRGERRS